MRFAALLLYPRWVVVLQDRVGPFDATVLLQRREQDLLVNGGRRVTVPNLGQVVPNPDLAAADARTNIRLRADVHAVLLAPGLGELLLQAFAGGP
jgi:hypothetical protein